MAQQVARADRTATPTSGTDALLPAVKLLRRFGLHLIAVLLGILLMLPFYWALVSSLKMPHEVRLVPPTMWPTLTYSPRTSALRASATRRMPCARWVSNSRSCPWCERVVRVRGLCGV